MEDENVPSESLPEELLSSDTEETVDGASEQPAEPQQKQEEAITLEELNKQLGRNYKDKESALKSLRDTRKAATTREDKVEAKLREQGYMTRDEFETEMFYGKNEEYSKNREIIDALAIKHGKSPRDVVQMDTYKEIATKVKGYDESQSVKSVLESNPRLGQARDTMADARKKSEAARSAYRDGDISTGIAQENAAASGAIRAVLNAYDQ